MKKLWSVVLLLVVLPVIGAALLVFVTPVDRSERSSKDPRSEALRLLHLGGYTEVEIYKEIDREKDPCTGWSVEFWYYAFNKDGLAVEGVACGVDTNGEDWNSWEVNESPAKTKELIQGFGYSDINIYETQKGLCKYGNVIYLFRAVSPNGKNVEGTACGYDPQNYKIWEK